MKRIANNFHFGSDDTHASYGNRATLPQWSIISDRGPDWLGLTRSDAARSVLRCSARRPVGARPHDAIDPAGLDLQRRAGPAGRGLFSYGELPSPCLGWVTENRNHKNKIGSVSYNFF